MYAYIRGILIEAHLDVAIVDVGGLGYKLYIPISDLGRMPSFGEEVILHTSWVVREHAQTLYGFLDKEVRDVFEMLITLSGIGPKTALSLLGHLDPQALDEAAQTDNRLALSKVPGIGKKTAERLLVELRSKLKTFKTVPSKPVSKVRDALQALINLGYSHDAAEKAVNKALEVVSKESDLSTLISSALQIKK